MSQVSLGLESSVLLASRGKPAELSMLVSRVADPVHSRVVPDGWVLRVNEDDLKVLVGGILVHPVGVEHPESTALSSDLLLGAGLCVSLWLQLGDTLGDWLTIHNTLWDLLLSSSTSDARSVHHHALLGLISHTSRLIWTSWAGQATDTTQLPVFPATNAKQKTQNVALLLPPKLLDVLNEPRPRKEKKRRFKRVRRKNE